MSPCDALFLLGLTLTGVGMVLILIALMSTTFKPGARYRRKAEWGGVIFIGPLPIAFGSNRRVVKIVAIVAGLVALAILGIGLLSLL